MATFKAMVIKGNLRTSDNTYNCVIRVTHNRKSKYIKTALYVSPKQVNKLNQIKDPFVLDSMNSLIKQYRDRLVSIADKMEYYDIDTIADYVTRSLDDIDFIEYGNKFISKMAKEGSRSNYRTVLNAMTDYQQSASIPISKINASFLKGFEVHLTSTRSVTRIDRWGVSRTVKEPPVSTRTVFNYMNAMKAIFNAARLEYNNEDVGDIRIPFYPFRKYKIPQPGASLHRNLTADKVRSIREASGFARDVFMISFYLCGMNTVDLYQAQSIRDGRIEYNRSKTQGKRSDSAFISIKIEPELYELIERYADKSGQRVFNFYQSYNVSRNFTGYVNYGLKTIMDGLTTYYARHSWATIARNECGIAKDVIAESLNHSSGLTVTDTYLARNWTAIDKANRAVLDLIANLCV